MTDTRIKQTGNSRLLRSALASDTTWADALAMLIAGTFPIDLLGLQTDGVDTEGTALRKSTLLSDETASALNLTSDDPTPNEAFSTLAAMLGGICFEIDESDGGLNITV